MAASPREASRGTLATTPFDDSWLHHCRIVQNRSWKSGYIRPGIGGFAVRQSLIKTDILAVHQAKRLFMHLRGILPAWDGQGPAGPGHLKCRNSSVGRAADS